MANILPHQVLRSLRRHVNGARDPIGNRDTPAQESQDIFGDAPEDDLDEHVEENDDVVGEALEKKPAEERPEEDNFGDAPGEAFAPSPVDIYVVRAMLVHARNLPIDIVDIIFEHAEYWAHSSNEIDYTVEHQSLLRVLGSSPVENKFILRSFPVGLTCAHHNKDLSEELAWDTTEAKPLPPPEKEYDAGYFRKLSTYPTPRLANPVRKIVFSIRSRDQGWGGQYQDRGTYNHSWTWFEAGLERFDADQTCDPQCTYDVRHKSHSTKASPLPVCGLRPLYPKIEPDQAHEGEFRYQHSLHSNTKHEICRNRTSTNSYDDRVIVWNWTDDVRSDSDEGMKLDEEQGRGRGTLDGEFVRNLKMGDVVTVWAHARFPGWANHIEKVKIEIFWAV